MSAHIPQIDPLHKHMPNERFSNNSMPTIQCHTTAGTVARAEYAAKIWRQIINRVANVSNASEVVECLLAEREDAIEAATFRGQIGQQRPGARWR